MLRIENITVRGFEEAIRGMRNPKNSWGKSDTHYCHICEVCPVCEDNHTGRCKNGIVIGPNDEKLMMRLASAGPVHGKYRRMIVVYADITAPLYWWKEFDTYKVGTVANSCSTMHKIHAKEFTLEDFSHEHLYLDENIVLSKEDIAPMDILERTIKVLNLYRRYFIETGNKEYWWQMIQLLPSSYNQRRTVMLNYEVLSNIYRYRRGHKLDEWHTLCGWVKELPYSELITCNAEKEGN